MTDQPRAGSVQRARLPVIEQAVERLTRLADTHAEAIAAVADLFAGRIATGGLIHVFGAGHSHMLAEEVFYRAGGLLSFNALLDPALMLHVSAVASGELERIAEYAHILLDQYTIAAGDAMLVISYSGINAVPVEIARISKRRGLPVVALTSVEASRNTPTRHPSGQRLYEVADFVLDNPGPVGDASLHVPGFAAPVCALSTITGAAILQSVVYEVVQRLHQAGIQPPVVQSINVAEQPSNHETLVAQYRHRLRHL